jgi:excisionase family DNA binding protein
MDTDTLSKPGNVAAPLLTVQESAAQIGVSETAIRNATLEGRLPFVRLYGRKLIEPVALEAYRQRTQPKGVKQRGRPKGGKETTE